MEAFAFGRIFRSSCCCCVIASWRRDLEPAAW